jgi:hypothetical protein
MVDRPMSRSDLAHPSRRSSALRRSLLGSGLALALAALPVTVAPDRGSLDWQTADARGGGGGGGGGGAGAGGGHGGGPGGGVAGGGRGPDGNGPPGQTHRGGVGELVESIRGGGRGGQGGEAFQAARDRYSNALARGGAARAEQVARPAAYREGREAGPPAYRFAPRETRHLIESGWRPRRSEDDGFKNHGERVRTMVELARRLGHGAHVGALQANFGTPYENGIAALQGELDHARQQLEGDPDNAELRAEVSRLEGELQAAVAAAKPGWGPDDGWATVDLDVNGDGVVDGRDLEALDQAASEQG